MKPEAIVLRAKNNLAEPLPQVVERGGVCLEGIITAEAFQKNANWLRWYAFLQQFDVVIRQSIA